MYTRPNLQNQQLVVGQKDSYRIMYDAGKDAPSGANGIVYPAQNVRTEKKVAIKLFSPRDEINSERLDRSYRLFKNEIKKVQSISYWNVIGILDWGDIRIGARKWPFTVMEFTPKSLRDRLKDPLSLLTKVFYCAQLSDAVAYLNLSAGLIHRDIKPENILVTDDELVRVSDLGIARFLPNFERNVIKALRLYPETTGIDKPRHYFSPEQLRRLDNKNEDLSQSDIFQLGKVFHEIFTGINPVGQINIDDDIYIEIPKQIRVVIRDMLSDNPHNRPPLEHCASILWVTLGITLQELVKQERKLTEAAKEELYGRFETKDSFNMRIEDLRYIEYFQGGLKKLYQLGYIKIVSPNGVARAKGREAHFPDYSYLDNRKLNLNFSLTDFGLDVRNRLLINDQWRRFMNLYDELGRSPTNSSLEYGRRIFKKAVKQWGLSKIQRCISRYSFIHDRSYGLYYLLPPILVGNQFWVEVQQDTTPGHTHTVFSVNTGYNVARWVTDGETKEEALNNAKARLLKEQIPKKDIVRAISSLEGLSPGRYIHVLPTKLDWSFFADLLSRNKQRPFRLKILASEEPAPISERIIYRKVEIQGVKEPPFAKGKEINFEQWVGDLFEGIPILEGNSIDMKELVNNLVDKKSGKSMKAGDQRQITRPIIVKSDLLWFFFFMFRFIDLTCDCIVECKEDDCRVTVLQPQQMRIQYAPNVKQVNDAIILLFLFKSNLELMAKVSSLDAQPTIESAELILKQLQELVLKRRTELSKDAKENNPLQ